MISCFNYAETYLSKYPKTSSELQKKLKEKGFSDEEIEVTILKLQQLGFLNDYLWTKLYIQSLARKGKNKFFISVKLREKGISKELFESVREEIEVDANAGIVAKLHKEVEKMQKKGFDNIKIKQKLYSKGYRKDQIDESLTNKEM